MGFGAGSPRKFLDFNSLKSHFLGLQVIIKDRILVRFQLGQCFLLFKYLSWKIWPISGENQCGFPAEKVSEKWVQKLLYILSMTIVFIWNCFHHPSPPNHPLHTSTFPLVSPERTANILQHHRWFPCEMMSEKWAQKFLFCQHVTTDPGSTSDWMNQIFSRSEFTAQIWVSVVSSVWNFCTCFSYV